jgi:hypothetical protein
MHDQLSKKIKVAGRAITVFKATFVMSLQRSILISNAGKEAPNGQYKDLDPSVANYVHEMLYPSLMACSQGSLPTEGEFMTLLEEDVHKWISAASEFNPDWFELGGASSQEKDKKEKKGSKPS